MNEFFCTADDVWPEVVIDLKTGVNYIVIQTLGNETAITPRLNADGTIYVSEECKKEVNK